MCLAYTSVLHFRELVDSCCNDSMLLHRYNYIGCGYRSCVVLTNYAMWLGPIMKPKEHYYSIPIHHFFILAQLIKHFAIFQIAFYSSFH